jgi:hypothetical protein
MIKLRGLHNVRYNDDKIWNMIKEKNCYICRERSYYNKNKVKCKFVLMLN